MKLMIASDLHGSACYTRLLLEEMEREKPDKLLLLGDILYHGPRNDLPKEYDPKAVAAMLNGVKEKLLCVRGNCDAEVDQMMLEFPILADCAVLWADGLTIHAVHGHKDDGPKAQKGELVLQGHTHVPECRQENGVYYVNPGSVSIPKNGSVHGYLILENRTLRYKVLEGETVIEDFTF